MKILIVSDTHRKDDNLRRVIEEEKPIDMLIHLGDSEGSEAWIGDWVNEGCCLEMVMGNNDFFSSLERELELELRGHRILLTHGHRPFLEERGGVTILNPGSLSYPRQEGRKPSYMIMYMEEDGSVRYERHFVS